MTSKSPPASPLGLADAVNRAQASREGKLNIVAHNGSSVYGGAERALIRLLAGLQQRGHRVSLACNHDIVADAAVRSLVPVLVQPLRGDLVLGDVLAFAKFLKREKPDALIIGTFKKIWLAGMAARRANVERVVARVGLASDTARRWKYRYALNRWVDTVVLNADAMRATFEKSAPGFDPDNLVTIHTGVQAPRTKQGPAAFRRSVGIAPDARVIGSVARLSKQKRLDRLLEAAAHLPGVHVVIAGEGTQREALEALRDKLGVKDRVHLLGERNDVGDVLAALDVFVLTSDQEGMSNAMLEALALGVPVVSTRVSGAEEALAPVDGDAPGVITGYESAEIANAVGALLRDPERLDSARLAALRVSGERFAFERMLDEWELLLREGPAALQRSRGG